MQNNFKRFLLYALLALLLNACASAPPEPALVEGPALIPLPAEMSVATGSYELTRASQVSAPGELAGAVAATRLLLGPATGYPFTEADDPAKAQITFNSRHVSKMEA